MMLKNLIILLVFLGLVGCGTSSKTVSPSSQSQQLDEWVAQNSFEINSDWAIPLMTNSMNQISNAGIFPPGSAANRISLIGNSNFLRFQNNTVSAYLPYFGERQAGGAYNGRNSGIEFDGIPEDLEISRDEKTLRHQIQFKIMDKTEAYNVSITLFPNLNSSIQINSSQRLTIRYNGRVSAPSKE